MQNKSFTKLSPEKQKKSFDFEEKEEISLQSPLKRKRINSSYRKFQSSASNVNQENLGRDIEIIKDKLYWISDEKPPRNIQDAFFFNVDEELKYFPFNKDFGPLNLAMVHRYSKELARLIQDKKYDKFKIYHYCSSAYPQNKMVNGAFLMGAFMIIILKMSADKAYEKFKQYHIFFRAYRDASKGPCLFNCTLLHCFQGIESALKFGWYDHQNFDIQSYEFHEKLENGDLNWIIPQKFVAFMGPLEQKDDNNYCGHHPSKYFDIFKKMNVTRVIRLNEEKYDRMLFVNQKIEHNDLFFTDGSNPPQHIVDQFFQIVEKHFSDPNSGAIAIHCKAGLGRTGTLIGLWTMKHYQITAEAFIGWIRIARPGSILGPQQFYLCQKEQDYIKTKDSAEKYRIMSKKLNDSPNDKYKSLYGEIHQASYLIGAKEKNRENKIINDLFSDKSSPTIFSDKSISIFQDELEFNEFQNECQTVPQ